jgi:hypothetical protein
VPVNSKEAVVMGVFEQGALFDFVEDDRYLTKLELLGFQFSNQHHRDIVV